VRGGIIGIVDLIDVVERHRSKWFSGPYGFVLANPRPLKKPIAMAGKLSLWEIPPAAVKSIRKQLGVL
jgi:hypothetical protein